MGNRFLLAHKAVFCSAVFYYQHCCAGSEKQTQVDVLAGRFMHQTLGEVLRMPLQMPLSHRPHVPPKSSQPEGHVRPAVRDRSGSQDRSGLETYARRSLQPAMVFQALEAETPFLPILTRVDSEVCSANSSRAEDEQLAVILWRSLCLLTPTASLKAPKTTHTFRNSRKDS